MQLLPLVKYFENPSSTERFNIITQILSTWQIPYVVQSYKTGKNVIVYPGNNKPVVGISSHFDVVTGSPGANDNASAIAVCLGIVNKLKTHLPKNIGIAVFFFDEEETGLKGSQAFVREQGIGAIKSLLNLEMVGQGDKLALWSLNESSTGRALHAFEAIAKQQDIFCRRFDKIVTNSADHISFLNAGVKDAFTITCISNEDLTVATAFYKAQQSGASTAALHAIIQQAPLFKHYHRATDISANLNEQSLQMVLSTVWQTLLRLDEQA